MSCLNCKWWRGWWKGKEPDAFTAEDLTEIMAMDASAVDFIVNGECFRHAPTGPDRFRSANNTPKCGDYDDRV